MVDPRSRRRSWLLATMLDGRRTGARYADRSAYLAAAVAVALVALLGACQPLTPQPPQVSPSVLASPTSAASAIDAEGAKAALERFLGRSVDAEASGPSDTPANGPIFTIEGPSLTAAVSAADGRVISVLLLDKLPNSRIKKLSPADAVSAGEAFVGSHGVSIDGLTATVELMDHGDTVAYAVTWTLIDRNIELPIKTMVQVDAASGEVFEFGDMRRSFASPPDPTISLQLAVSAARLAASMPSATADGPKLRVTFTADGTQQLVWEIALTNGVAYALVDVDALTGAAVVVGRG